ncbi:MAG: hypothetical protein LBT46_11675 [Planctomycetaceae bacterium]|jgi:hypothetical protein|nr:hypothetical protein [Planctomycetaceae bacterium]
MGKDAQFFVRFCFIVTLFVFARIAEGQTFTYETDNFIIVDAPDALTAKQCGDAAEKYRRDLSLLWLGKTLPDWSAKCPVKVRVGSNLGAGGATTFVFDKGEVYDWDMDIQGSKERILDSVLPHEITHIVFATHFRRPIPRWLDEGAAASVENITEKKNYQRLLLTFLQSRHPQCLPFNQLVAVKEYPDDPMPFYAQGFSIVEYLLTQGEQVGIEQTGHTPHRRLVQFMETVMNTGDWQPALQEHYHIDSLGTLQTRWVAWVGHTNNTPAQEPVPAVALVNSEYGKSVYEQ